MTDEKITAYRAEFIAAQTPNASDQTVASLFERVPLVGGLLKLDTASRKAKLEEDLAWLETRRLSLKQELLRVFVKRTVQNEGDFSICVDGIQRQYQAVEGGRFTRLAAGVGPCEKIGLQSLQREEQK